MLPSGLAALHQGDEGLTMREWGAVLFIAIGLCSMLAIFRVDFLTGFALGAAGVTDPALHEFGVALSRPFGLRVANTILGAGIGALLFTVVNAAQTRWAL